MPTIALQTLELKRVQAARAEQATEVSRLEAEEAAATQRNMGLNKTVNTLQAEVGAAGRLPAMGCSKEPCRSCDLC